MNPTLPQTSQQISDDAEKLSKLAFAAGKVNELHNKDEFQPQDVSASVYDQANEEPELAQDTFDPVADEKRFMAEFLESTGYVQAVDMGRTALRTQVVTEDVPSEAPLVEQVAAPVAA